MAKKRFDYDIFHTQVNITAWVSFIIFLTFKLTGVIDWGWFYIFIPLIVLALEIILSLVVVITIDRIKEAQ